MKTMRLLRTVLLHFLVWLTSATTLVAGTPLLLCACPQDRIKTPNPTTNSTAVCCCCRVVEKPTQTTCCKEKSKSTDDDGTPSVRPQGCRKNLVEPRSASAARADTESHVV